MKIEVIKGDITKLEVDIIVNAANTSLLGGGGVDGVIHKAGGREILEECRKIRNRQGGCKVGEAVITKAGKLKAKKIIHTVGPKWNNGISDEESKLRNCYRESIKLAIMENAKSIAFPNISTGIYGFPKKKAAEIAMEVALEESTENSIEKLIFVCFDDENLKLYKSLLSVKLGF